MSKRSKKCRDEHGKWDPGGGSINFSENLERTLRREVKEEYCTTIIESEFLGYRDAHRVDEKGRKTHWIALDFKVSVDPKKVRNGEPNKHEEIRWFRINKLPKPLHSMFPLFLKLYKSKL